MITWSAAGNNESRKNMGVDRLLFGWRYSANGADWTLFVFQNFGPRRIRFLEKFFRDRSAAFLGKFPLNCGHADNGRHGFSVSRKLKPLYGRFAVPMFLAAKWFNLNLAVKLSVLAPIWIFGGFVGFEWRHGRLTIRWNRLATRKSEENWKRTGHKTGSTRNHKTRRWAGTQQLVTRWWSEEDDMIIWAWCSSGRLEWQRFRIELRWACGWLWRNVRWRATCAAPRSGFPLSQWFTTIPYFAVQQNVDKGNPKWLGRREMWRADVMQSVNIPPIRAYQVTRLEHIGEASRPEAAQPAASEHFSWVQLTWLRS